MDASGLTTTDVAEAAAIPIGSLYEYFVDLAAICDAAADYVLSAHSAAMHRRAPAQIETAEAFIGEVAAAWAEVYADDQAVLALRSSVLFTPRHRIWAQDHTIVHLHALAKPGSALTALPADARAVTLLMLVLDVFDAVAAHTLTDTGCVSFDGFWEITASTRQRLAR